ncbi:hypothetical protein [Celeribacter litoreus]|uniref:hypothetical protein n=1 Tax=Celeribacter litoreus TaxID=2876714 RepID=UPI001CCC2970|nr:hypothetical protein [Celeribacter litoreus]MCA0044657.1 hypothetical protein [Celeribacter litoreus]
MTPKDENFSSKKTGDQVKIFRNTTEPQNGPSLSYRIECITNLWRELANYEYPYLIREHDAVPSSALMIANLMPRMFSLLNEIENMPYFREDPNLAYRLLANILMPIDFFPHIVNFFAQEDLPNIVQITREETEQSISPEGALENITSRIKPYIGLALEKNEKVHPYLGSMEQFENLFLINFYLLAGELGAPEVSHDQAAPNFNPVALAAKIQSLLKKADQNKLHKVGLTYSWGNRSDMDYPLRFLTAAWKNGEFSEFLEEA